MRDRRGGSTGAAYGGVVSIRWCVPRFTLRRRSPSFLLPPSVLPRSFFPQDVPLFFEDMLSTALVIIALQINANRLSFHIEWIRSLRKESEDVSYHNQRDNGV